MINNPYHYMSPQNDARAIVYTGENGRAEIQTYDGNLVKYNIKLRGKLTYLIGSNGHGEDVFIEALDVDGNFSVEFIIDRERLEDIIVLLEMERDGRK